MTILPALRHSPIIRVELGDDQGGYRIGFLIGDVTTNVVGSTFYQDEFPVFLAIEKKLGAAFLFAETADGYMPITRLTRDHEGHQGLALLCDRLAGFFCRANDSDMCRTLLDESSETKIKAYGIEFATRGGDECHGAYLALPAVDKHKSLQALVRWGVEGGAMLLGGVVTPKVLTQEMRRVLLKVTAIPEV